MMSPVRIKGYGSSRIEAVLIVVRVPLDEVREDWLSSAVFSKNLYTIANHYGLFDDLFKHGYFYPRIPLNINYPYENEQVTPVYCGNRLYAKDVRRFDMENMTLLFLMNEIFSGTRKTSRGMEI